MKKISLAILTLLVVLSACKKVPEVNLKYVDVKRDLITVGTTTATVQCDYQYIATLKKAYLYYGEGENEADMNAAEMRVVQNTLYVDLASMKENTTYSYYYEFHNGFNSMRTMAKTFKTEGSGTTTVLPTVVTANVTMITTISAKSGGEVTDDGGAEVTERGICWSTNANPTLNDNHVAAGTGMGAFTAMMDDLEANTTYHVCAYATNEAGTTYGLDKEFTTLLGGGGGGNGDVPTGAINGLFTINENGDKVYFSKGNLQYQASTNTWRFADNQWDFVGGTEYFSGEHYGNVIGSSNNEISSTYTGWIDLFGWGTSGWNNGNECFQPWDYGYDYQFGPHGNFDLTDAYANADWGVYNPISNGDNNNSWRSLTNAEYEYVFKTRNTTSGIRYAKAIVNSVPGMIAFPDNWDASNYHIVDSNDENSVYSSNIISIFDWENSMEYYGTVFFPSAGIRSDTLYNYDMGGFHHGFYWTSTSYFETSALDFVFTGEFIVNHVYAGDGMDGRNNGESVRLVQDAN